MAGYRKWVYSKVIVCLKRGTVQVIVYFCTRYQMVKYIEWMLCLNDNAFKHIRNSVYGSVNYYYGGLTNLQNLVCTPTFH